MTKKQFCARHSSYDSGCVDCVDASIDEIELEDILKNLGDLLDRWDDDD